MNRTEFLKQTICELTLRLNTMTENNSVLQKRITELNERCNRQNIELRRLNNTQKLAEKFAKEVVKNCMEEQQNEIKRLKETVVSQRHTINIMNDELQKIYGADDEQ